MSGRVRGGRGYLLIDNRANGGGMVELPTLTCAHCNAVVVLNGLRKRDRGLCRKCMAYVCDAKGCNEECNPTEQMVELAQLHPDQQWLGRGPAGEPLFDRRLKERHRIF